MRRGAQRRLETAAWLLLAIWALSGVGVAQILPGTPAADLPAPATTRRNVSARELEQRFQRARELIAEGNYADGVRLLQSILDVDEDAFFTPDRESTGREKSLKFETQGALGSLPAAGRKAYEKQFGPAARRLLGEVATDPDRLAQVSRRYFHTQAGYEAAYRLAGAHLDRGHPLSAALCFERLRETPQADDQFEPLLSIKAALSWLHAGREDKAREVLSQLTKRYRLPTFALGGREISLTAPSGDALDWLVDTLGGGRELDVGGAGQWTQVRGDGRRNAVSSAGNPHLNRGWRASTVDGATNSPENDLVLARAVNEQGVTGPDSPDDAPFIGLPAAQPLLVQGLVVVRGLSDVRAYDALQGRLVWAAGEKDPLLLDVLRLGAVPAVQGPGGSQLSQFVLQRGWWDATWGTISSDGEQVFCIEDGGGNAAMAPAGLRQPGPLLAVREFNRLVAYEVKSGRARWEAGGPKGDGSDELEGAFFLGAPLVLDRRLFCLVESGSEVRLAALDPLTGRVEWSQLLSDTPGQSGERSRRSSGLSPSFDGGILVCPVGSEQVVALDLTARSLLWRHRLRSAADFVDGQRQQLLALPQQRLPAAFPERRQWLDAQAIIADERVVLTPRETPELVCLNLLDGSLAWKQPRGDGLFVAGVYNGNVLVVGKSYLQALRLSDGSPAWVEPTEVPAPSGRGFLAGNTYYLPLSTAEVASIDVRDGRVVLRAKSFERRVPGNLVGVRGTIVSQGVDFVEGCRQIDSLDQEIAAALAQNPQDARALALRGEIRLGRGETREAYSDLRQALALKSDDAPLRTLLLESLLEGLRVDFAAYRDLEPEIERLLIDPRQRSTYRWLQAQGLLRVGQPLAAFEALLRFADPDVADSDMERVDAALVTRRDRLVRARAARLFETARGPEREQMRAALARRALAFDAADGIARQRFVDYFSNLLEPAHLSELALHDEGSGEWLAQEFRLLELADSADGKLAAAATERLVRLLMELGRIDDATQLVARIGREWPEQKTRDGVTGRELAAHWRERPEVARAIGPPVEWPQGQVTVSPQPLVGAGLVGRKTAVPFENERGPYFENLSVEVSASLQGFETRDNLGRPLWNLPLETPVLSSPLFNRAFSCDHLLVVVVGAQVTAIDTLGALDHPAPRILWRMSLSEFPHGAIVPRGARLFPRGLPLNQLGEQWGTIGPVTRRQIVVLKGSRLMALDPLTGKALWTRDAVKPGSDLFGDDEYLLAAPPDEDYAALYHPLDGTFLGLKPLPPAAGRMEFIGRRVATWQPRDAGQELALRDIPTDAMVWQRVFARDAHLALIEDDEAAVLEPAGRLTLLSLRDGRSRWTATIIPPSPNVQNLLVLRSRDHYILACNEPVPANVPWVASLPQLVGVNGDVYGFDRASGRQLWTHRIERQGLDLNQPSELPFLLFNSPIQPSRQNGPFLQSRGSILCIDKRNGRIIHQQQIDEAGVNIELRGDPAANQVDLRLHNSILRLTFTDKPWPEKP